MNKLSEEHNYPFPPRNSMFWESNSCTYDQAIELFHAQTPEHQHMGRTPVRIAKNDAIKLEDETYPELQQTITSTTESRSLAAQQAYDFTEPEWNNALKDDLKEYLEENQSLVVIYTLEDAVITLKALYEEHKKTLLELGAVAAAVFKVGKTAYSSSKIAKAFGDIGMVAKVFKDSNGNERISITTRHQSVKHILVNGVRIKMNSNKSYAIDNPKVIQTGVSPRVRMDGYKGAFMITFIISAAINTKDLILDDEYLLIDWLGNMGSDLLKAALSTLGAELMLLALPAATPFAVAATVCVFVAVGIAYAYDHFKVDERILEVIKGAEVKI